MVEGHKEPFLDDGCIHYLDCKLSKLYTLMFYLFIYFEREGEKH